MILARGCFSTILRILIIGLIAAAIYFAFPTVVGYFSSPSTPLTANPQQTYNPPQQSQQTNNPPPANNPPQPAAAPFTPTTLNLQPGFVAYGYYWSEKAYVPPGRTLSLTWSNTGASLECYILTSAQYVNFAQSNPQGSLSAKPPRWQAYGQGAGGTITAQGLTGGDTYYTVIFPTGAENMVLNQVTLTVR